MESFNKLFVLFLILCIYGINTFIHKNFGVEIFEKWKIYSEIFILLRVYLNNTFHCNIFCPAVYLIKDLASRVTTKLDLDSKSKNKRRGVNVDVYKYVIVNLIVH